jgi:crotonobetainyl-CoA:carnitine CoA-transferase CaiB-like acyl-CoA transferase
MPGPLDGFTVIDLTTVISGPFATMLLGDQGANVIKVEQVSGGDHARGAGYGTNQFTASFVNNNRSKRGICLDLKQLAGRDTLFKLVANADVLIQNFRPGVVDRLGINEDAIRQHAPNIIYASISGFGEDGPWSHKPVYDPIVQALSGLTTIQGGSDDARPRLVRTILPDKLTGLTMAQAVTAALAARERTGEGQHVRVSMLDAVIAFLWASDMGGQTFVGKEVSTQRAATFIDLIYETRDGFISVSAMKNEHWEALCRVVGHPEWLDDERFSTPAARDAHANERLELTQSVLYERTAEEWLTLLDSAGVPSAPVLTRREMIDHPQVVASNLIIETEHPIAGPLRQTRPAARFDKTPPEIRRGAPLHGEHTTEVLAEIGLSSADIEQLKDLGAIK